MREMTEKQSNFESQLASSISSVGDYIDKKIDSLRNDLQREFGESSGLTQISQNYVKKITCASLAAQIDELCGLSSQHEDRYNDLADQMEFQQKEYDLVVCASRWFVMKSADSMCRKLPQPLTIL